VAHWLRIAEVTGGAPAGHRAGLPARRPAVTNPLLKDTGSPGTSEGPYRSAIPGRRHARPGLPRLTAVRGAAPAHAGAPGYPPGANQPPASSGARQRPAPREARGPQASSPPRPQGAVTHMTQGGNRTSITQLPTRPYGHKHHAITSSVLIPEVQVPAFRAGWQRGQLQAAGHRQARRPPLADLAAAWNWPAASHWGVVGRRLAIGSHSRTLDPVESHSCWPL
jgi:hypothetical protein